jgi:hypothetical protein
MAQRAKYTSPWDTINPYVSWALGPGRKQYFIPGRQVRGQELTPLLLKLKGDTAQAFLDGVFIESEERRKRWQDSFEVLCRTEPENRKSTVWAGTMATEDIVRRIASQKARRSVDSVSLGRPLDTQALPAAKRPPKIRRAARRRAMVAPGPPAHPPAIVMGVIDDGIAFANERFRRIVGGTIGSRVEHWWLQDGPLAPPHFPFLPAGSQTVLFGCELNRQQIDNLLANCTTAGVVDEDLVYRKAHLVEYSKVLVGSDVTHQSAARRAAHGTHVMDLACGFDPSPPVRNRPIVCVQLPTRVTADEQPGDLNYYIAKGIEYIVEGAVALAPSYGVATLPVVINVSYGLTADPHDGTGGLEALIEGKIAECKARGFDLRVVLPSGNSYLSRIHGRVSFASVGQTQELDWRVLPDDRTASVLEVWLPAPLPNQSRITLKVTSPNGASMTLLELGTMAKLSTPAGDYAWAYWALHSPSDRSWFMVVVQSTAHRDPATPVAQLAPAGIWKVELTHTGGLAAAPRDVVHAWIRRDDQVYGFPLRGRQSYLDHADYTRFDHAGRDEQADDPASLVRRESTINSMATGGTAIVMGGYLGKERLPAKYSAAGAVPPQIRPPPPPDLTPRWPDAMAVSEDSRVHAGVLAAGSYSGSVIAMGGTSVAAPQIARMVADNLAIGGTGDRAVVRNLATAMATGIPLPRPDRSGAGGILPNPIVTVKRYD